jgi:hypothetical protein
VRKYLHYIKKQVSQIYPRYYSTYDSRYNKTEILALKHTTCSQVFAIKLTVRTLSAAEKFSRRQTSPVARDSVAKVCNYLDVYRTADIFGADTITQTGAVESICIFKNTQMQDPDFTPVNPPSATDTQFGPACESLVTGNPYQCTGLHYVIA